MAFSSGLSEGRLRWLDDSTAARELEAARAFGERIADSATSTHRRVVAQAFSGAVLKAYWGAAQRQYRRPWILPKGPVDPEAAGIDRTAIQAALRAGEVAAEIDLNTASYLIGRIYTSMLPDQTRSRLGVYYTPPPLVSRLIESVSAAGVDWRTAQVIDPACGGGAFLAPVAARIAREMADREATHIIESIGCRLHGLEVDPFAAWMSQVFVEIALMPVCRAARKRLPAICEVRDSLILPAARHDFDLVIGNPPFGRVPLSDEMRARYARGLYGHANLYGLFTDLALGLARPGGVIAYVTPTGFLAGEYFKRLRQLLAREAPPINIDFVASRDRVFDDVLQETALTTFRYRPGRPTASVHLVEVRTGGAKITPTGRFALPREPGAPWIIPRSSEQTSIVDRLLSFTHRLSDYGYSVSTGPLVWNRHKDQLAPERRKDTLPLIWAECVTSDGRFVFRAHKKNHAPYFMPRAGDKWLITRRSCVLLQRTTAKEQNRRLIAAELPAQFVADHGGVVVENHLNMIWPNREPPVVAPAALAALLNSAIIDRAFRCISGSVAVSAFELESLPLPPPSSLSALLPLLRRGAPQEEIDTACERLFAMEDAA
jgi:adenine-specific DNA-methyltransferase